MSVVTTGSSGPLSRRQVSALQARYYTYSNPSSKNQLYLFPKSQKVIQEEALIRRRNSERERNEYWGEATKYYDRVRRSTGKYEEWSSPQSQKQSMDAFNRIKDVENRRSRLLVRREKLKQLLAKEQAQYEEELKSLPVRPSTAPVTRAPTLDELRAQKEALRRERQQKQEKEAEEKMLLHWKLNNPEFRELRMKKHRELVQLSWEEQRREQAEKRRFEKQSEAEALRLETQVRAEKERLAEKDAEERRRKLLEWKETVLWQIEEVRKRDKEEVEIKEQVRKELEKEAELFQMEEKRKQIQERRKKQELGHFLHRQHRLKLLAKAEQVERELEEDGHFLMELQKLQEAQEEADEKRREDRRKELQWMQQVLKDQESEEYRRKKQMDFLFTEEAESFWDRQNKLWKDEEQARNQLMDDVISNWKKQIEQNVKASEKRAENLSEERAQIQSDLEALTEDIEAKEKELERQNEAFAQGLQDQIDAKTRSKQLEKDKMTSKQLRDMHFHDSNQLAEKLARFDMEDPNLGVTDFRRRKVKWY